MTRRALFFQAIIETGSMPEAADRSGLSRAYVYRARAHNPSFAAEWAKAMATFFLNEAVRHENEARRHRARLAS